MMKVKYFQIALIDLLLAQTTKAIIYSIVSDLLVIFQLIAMGDVYDIVGISITREKNGLQISPKK